MRTTIRSGRCGWWLSAAGVALAGVVLGAQAGDAGKVLAEVRQALGGDKKLDAIRTITATGRMVRTSAAGTTTEGEFELAMELPDKFIRRDLLAALGTMSVYRVSGFNGDGLINEVDQPPQLSGGNVIIHAVVTGPGGAAGEAQTPEQKEVLRKAMLQSARCEFARLALGMFAASTPVFPTTFSYAGTAESPDGTADVVEVKGENGFSARLFIDRKTHLPLMLTWMDKEPLRIVRRTDGPGGGGAVAVTGGVFTATGGGQGVAAGAAKTPPTAEEREKLVRELAEQAKAAEATRKTVEFRLFYADYRAEDGIVLPHRIQSAIDGRPTDEISLEKVKVNGKVDAKRFTVSK